MTNAGKTWAEWMVKALHGKGNVIFLGGPAGSPVGEAQLSNITREKLKAAYTYQFDALRGRAFEIKAAGENGEVGVAAVDHDFDLTGQRAVALHDRVPIAGQHRTVLTAPAAEAAGGASFVDETPETLDVRAGNGFTTEDALEPVELRRIVRAGHLHAAVHVEHMGREVERGRRQLAHVHGVAAHGLDAGEQAVREPRSGGPVVPPDGQPGGAPQTLPAERCDRLADGAGALRRELGAHDAADVVLAKDGGG